MKLYDAKKYILELSDADYVKFMGEINKGRIERAHLNIVNKIEKEDLKLAKKIIREIRDLNKKIKVEILVTLSDYEHVSGTMLDEMDYDDYESIILKEKENLIKKFDTKINLLKQMAEKNDISYSVFIYTVEHEILNEENLIKGIIE